MKRLALAISALAVIATGALANPAYSWTGFYLGGNAGYSWGRTANTLGFTDAGTTVSDHRWLLSAGLVGWPTIAERSFSLG